MIEAIIIALLLALLTISLAVAFFVIGLSLEIALVHTYSWLRRKTFR